MSTSEMEKCANCGRTIGKLETPNVFKDQIVCAECYTRLSPAVEYATPAMFDPIVPRAPTLNVKSATDAIVLRILAILLLLGLIGVCSLVIFMKMTGTW